MTKNDELATKIQRFYELNSKRKEMELEEKQLKEWFKAEAKSDDTSFEFNGIEVLVASKSRSTWDTDKLRMKLGQAISKYKKPVNYVEVSVRPVTKKAG